MKFFLTAMLLPLSAMALECQVDGISDSPQKLNCYIHDNLQIERLTVSCNEGLYQIAWKNKKYLVDLAYHEEVESGSNPLVFINNEMTLRTISYSIYSRASFTLNEQSYDGLCFDK